MVKMGGKIWERLLPLSLFLVLYELAAESSFYLLELSLVLLFVCFVWEERQALLHPVGTMQEGIGLLKPLLPAWGMLAVYLLWDLVTVFYSPLREGVLAKYKVVCLMLFFSALILWYARTERRRRLRLLLQVLVAAGLTGDNTVTPYKVAQFSAGNGYYAGDSGTSWSLMTEGAQQFGIYGEEMGLSEDEVFSALENGHPIICSMRPGDFTTTGHFIVLTGVEDGKIRVNDPNSRVRSGKLWDYSRLEYQINNLWVYTAM